MPPRARASPARATKRVEATASPVSSESARKKVAVVGSGVAGLSAAFLLSRKHDVHVFEREAAVGMDAHSLDAHGARMDIPLRVFSESYYPNLCNLYKMVGVKYRIADYSFSCIGGADGSAAAYFRYVNLFLNGMALPIPACFNPLQLAKCARLFYNFAHFVRHSPAYMAADDADISLSDFLSLHGYPAIFGSELLYPMLSVVCTCTYKSVAAYPAQIVVDYFANKYGLSGAQCRAYGGTRDVVARLTEPVTRVVTSASIEGVAASKASCTLTWRDAAGRTHSEDFDEVVLAMQANASRKVLRTGAAPAQLCALEAFPYEKKRVVLHTDPLLMPAQRRDWSPLNIVVTPSEDAASVTVWMNHIDKALTAELSAPVFQTWNPVIEPETSTVIADFAFERPVVTAASVRAMAALQEAQGDGHVWFVGAYSLNSMPLLENGVKSAMMVARHLGVDTSDVEFDESTHVARQLAASKRSSGSWLMALLLLLALLMISA